MQQPEDSTRQRIGRSPRDMALSLLVLLVPIFVLLGVYRCLGGEQAQVIDPSAAYADARAARIFPVAEPSALTGWQPVSSAFRRGDAGAVLRVGLRSPGGDTAQLIESNVAPGALVAAELGGAARDDGTVSVAGQQWRRYATADGQRALVLDGPDRTLMVVGRASEAELSRIAASLR